MTKKRQVKAPTSIDVIRLRKETFIGDCENPNHLVHEALDNAFDELRNKHGTKSELHINDDGSVWIMDNGRGLPQGKVLIEETGEKKDALETIFIHLHSGTKFDMNDYESLFGQNGIGLTATNALSEWVDVYVKKLGNKNHTLNYKFEDSKLVKNEIFKKRSKWSTMIGFKPNKKYFEKLEYNLIAFEQRMKLAMAKYDWCSFSFNGTSVPKNTFEEFARETLELDKETPLFKIEYVNGKEEITIFLTYVEGKSIVMGDANLRLCGGTYLTSFQNILKKLIPPKLDKKFDNVPERYLTDGLRAFVSIKITEPKFDSQTKVRLTTRVKKTLFDPLENDFNKILSNKYIKEIIEKILERKINKNIKNASTKIKGISPDNKLKDCFNRPGDTLYLLEGDSASSTLERIRNKHTEASLAVKGKVINVEKQTLDRISKSKAIKDMIEAIGSKNNRRYKKIKILADADADGGDTHGHLISLIR